MVHLDCVVPEKKTYPPYRRSLEIPRGRGVLKAKFLVEIYENKLEFPGGGDAKQETFCGEVWIFSETAHFLGGHPPKFEWLILYWQSSD